MGVGAGLYMYVVVQKFTFAISSPDEFLSVNVGNVLEQGFLYKYIVFHINVVVTWWSNDEIHSVCNTVIRLCKVI